MKRCLCGIIAVVLLFLVGCNEKILDEDKKSYAESFWTENKESLMSATKEAFSLLENTEKDIMILTLTGGNVVCEGEQSAEYNAPSLKKIMMLSERPIWIREKSIEFGLPGAGFGPNTSYCGLIYIPSDDINDFPYSFPELDLTYAENAVYGSSRSTDNRVYIERIENCVFYYEMSF